MASVGGTGGSRGRRKSLDAEINLVPFIDLLSMCICFLLMTAVWMQIGALQVKQLVGTEAPSSTSSSYEMDVRYATKDKLEVALKYPGKRNEKFSVTGANGEERVQNLQKVLDGLAPILKLNPAFDLKAQLGRLISVARVTTKAGVNYGELVMIMDTLRDHGIVNLGVVPVRE